MDSPSSAECTDVTYLRTPVLTPLARVRRIFFDKTFTILMESKINAHARLGTIQNELNEESNPSKQVLIANEAHDIFRSALDQCLESLNRVILDSFDRLVKIAISHTEWTIDDPAEWARCRAMELVDERLSSGRSDLPTVDRWFRWACDGDPIERESSGFVEPWCAPVWCSRDCDFSIRVWRNTGSHGRHSAERTERLISGDRDMWREQLKNELARAADQAGIDIDVQRADRITRGPIGLTNEQARIRVEGTKSANQERPKQKDFVASADYRTIRFRSKEYRLTNNQAVMIRLLHEAYQCRTPAVGKRTLLAAVEAETSRVRDSFKNSPLWGKLVIANQKPRGTYQLNLK